MVLVAVDVVVYTAKIVLTNVAVLVAAGLTQLHADFASWTTEGTAVLRFACATYEVHAESGVVVVVVVVVSVSVDATVVLS